MKTATSVIAFALSVFGYAQAYTYLGYGVQGCCPIIKPLGDGLKGYSVIVADSGHRGNVAIIVDWGTCTAQPAGGFEWYVSWGDGASSYQQVTTLGPFQATHQYADAQGSYYVTAQFCSTPPNGQRCCDDVSCQISFAY
ncbi:hypothetical protein EMCRGX_G027139 [Ephydatia muelleri]|eukprot:Em0014g188a